MGLIRSLNYFIKSIWYNEKTNELGLFDYSTLETKTRKRAAKLVLVKRGSSKSNWIYIGDL